MINKQWNGVKFTLRPSSIDASMNCPWSWYLTHVCGNRGLQGGRASIGTAVHKAADVLWSESIASGVKDSNINKLNDAAIAKMQELDKEGVQYDEGEDLNTAEKTVIKGVKSLVVDIAPYTDIPIFSEKRFTVAVTHPVISDISGTVDYISHDTLADLKTSKKKPTASAHVTQQSTYKYLAEANGFKTNYSVLQGVVFLKASTVGHIIPLVPDIDLAKRRINMILDTLDVMVEDKVSPEVLFRPNPKNYLCSPKYCTFYEECKAT